VLELALPQMSLGWKGRSKMFHFFLRIMALKKMFLSSAKNKGLERNIGKLR
jgi:hypothetical protein